MVGNGSESSGEHLGSLATESWPWSLLCDDESASFSLAPQVNDSYLWRMGHPYKRGRSLEERPSEKKEIKARYSTRKGQFHEPRAVIFLGLDQICTYNLFISSGLDIVFVLLSMDHAISIDQIEL